MQNGVVKEDRRIDHGYSSTPATLQVGKMKSRTFGAVRMVTNAIISEIRSDGEDCETALNEPILLKSDRQAPVLATSCNPQIGPEVV